MAFSDVYDNRAFVDFRMRDFLTQVAPVPCRVSGDTRINSISSSQSDAKDAAGGLIQAFRISKRIKKGNFFFFFFPFASGDQTAFDFLSACL